MNKHNEINAVNGLQLLTVPVRIHSFLNDKVKQCVEMENKTAPDNHRQMTAQEFIRQATAEKVARTLREEISEIPPVIRGRGGSLVAQLAKQLGVTRQQLESKAAEIIAAQAFGFKYDPDKLMADIMNGDMPVIGGNAPKPRAASKSGQHQITTHHSGPGVRSVRRSG